MTERKGLSNIEGMEIDPYDIPIPEMYMAARLGFKGLNRIPDDHRELYEDLLHTARKISEIECLWGDAEYGPVCNDNMILGVPIEATPFQKHLRGTTGWTFFLVTLGSRVDDEIDDLHRKGRDLNSFFLDGIASELVEFAARRSDAHLRELHQGRDGSIRLSPGYAGLPLSLNERIIKELGGEIIGVSFKEGSYMLIPRKTISAFIGWKWSVEKKR